MDIPKIIDGIATDKNASEQRRNIIKQTYIDLLHRLQKTKGKKAVLNHFLGVDVFIIMRESEQKTSNSGANNWQSTYAVKHLETVIKNAKAKDGVPVYSLPKTGKQKSFKYVNMAVLFYEFVSEEYDYLNFTVKLTLGIKNDGRHIQYSVNKVDIVKNKTIL
jgi:flagellar hook-associated protein FlgK